MPGIFKTWQTCSKRIIMHWAVYDGALEGKQLQPVPSDVEGLARILMAFNAMIRDPLRPRKALEQDTDYQTLMMQCWQASVAASLIILPGVSPVSRLGLRGRARTRPRHPCACTGSRMIK